MATTVSFTPTRCIMGAGKFDTDRRYIRAGSAGAGFPIVRDRTVRTAVDPSNVRYVMWRWTNSVSAAEWRISGAATGLGNASATLATL
jgi:hypothetical protein